MELQIDMKLNSVQEEIYKRKEFCFDTYAPVAKFDSVRVLLALATLQQWELEQVDVTTAFLYAPLEEEIYMRQPPHFEVSDISGRSGKN